jgi:hypothetical protein
VSERVDPFASFKEQPAFTTKPKPERQVEPEAIAEVAEQNNFTSRQAPKSAKKAERRKPRIHRTGRNVQFNTKAQQDTIDRFYRQADARKITLGEAFELAVEALERAGVSEVENKIDK